MVPAQGNEATTVPEPRMPVVALEQQHRKGEDVMVTKRRERRLGDIQARADRIRAVGVEIGHACKEHLISPETMALLLAKHDVRDVEEAVREYAGGEHDPFRGL